MYFQNRTFHKGYLTTRVHFATLKKNHSHFPIRDITTKYISWQGGNISASQLILHLHWFKNDPKEALSNVN